MQGLVHVDLGRTLRGGQVQVLHLMKRLPGMGVICMEQSPLFHRARERGFVVFPVKRAQDCHRVLRSLAPSLVAAHCHLAHRWTESWQPVVHRRVDFRPSRWGAARLRRARGIIAVSNAVRRVLERAGVPGAVVVGDAVDGSHLQTIAPVDLRRHLAGRRLGPGPLLLSVGALVDHKDHRTLLEAFARVDQGQLLLAGTGPLRLALERERYRLGLQERVHFLGFRQDVHQLMASADLVVHSAKMEGRGTAPMEALTLGRPVVSTWAGGLAESLGAVVDLVPPQDPAALAVGLQTALTDLARLRERQQSRLDPIQHRWSADVVANQTYAAYQQMAGR